MTDPGLPPYVGTLKYGKQAPMAITGPQRFGITIMHRWYCSIVNIRFISVLAHVECYRRGHFGNFFEKCAKSCAKSAQI